jgi:NAD(P)-dependent dehydrogenase (short-subunit alcohol dehydrogenase family)
MYYCNKYTDVYQKLILSAGINANQYGEDADGIDRHFGVNWLGHFYAVNLLYPLLRRTSQLPDTPAPRIVFEASEMHRGAPSNVHFGSLEEINNPHVGNTELYGRTKLAIILGVKYGIVKRVIEKNGDNIYALSVHPGAVCSAHALQKMHSHLTGEDGHAAAMEGRIPRPIREDSYCCYVGWRPGR